MEPATLSTIAQVAAGRTQPSVLSCHRWSELLGLIRRDCFLDTCHIVPAWAPCGRHRGLHATLLFILPDLPKPAHALQFSFLFGSFSPREQVWIYGEGHRPCRTTVARNRERSQPVAAAMRDREVVQVLYWEVPHGTRLTCCQRDAAWATWTAKVGFPVMALWRAGDDRSDINAVCRDGTGALVAAADDFGAVRLARYPCVMRGAALRRYRAHAAHVTAVRFLADSRRLVSGGGGDACVLQWRVVPQSGGEAVTSAAAAVAGDGSADGIGAAGACLPARPHAAARCRLTSLPAFSTAMYNAARCTHAQLRLSQPPRAITTRLRSPSSLGGPPAPCTAGGRTDGG